MQPLEIFDWIIELTVMYGSEDSVLFQGHEPAEIRSVSEVPNLALIVFSTDLVFPLH